MAQKLDRCPLKSTAGGQQPRQKKSSKDEKSTNFQRILPPETEKPSFLNQKRVALGSISVNTINQQQSQKDLGNLKKSVKPSQPFAIFCDESQKTAAEEIQKKSETDEFPSGILSLLVGNKQKSNEGRCPLAPLAVSDGVHWLENVKTNGRDLFNLSADNETELVSNEFDENSNESVYISAVSSSRDEFFPTKENLLTEKEKHFNLIICPPDFVKEIYEHERTQEIRIRPRPQYIVKQPHLTAYMRMILVDWMVDVAVEYHLEQETLHLAVNYVDRFLSLMVVDKEKLQLVGTTALLIASKYEEIYPPDLEQFVFITDDSYSIKQVLKMERYLLSTLQFEMSVPTINFFMDHFLHVCHAGQRCECVAKYLSELVLLDIVFLNFLPSVVAAAIVFMANYTTETIPWPVDLELASQYTVADIYPCATLVLDAFKKAPELQVQAVCDKYKEHKYCQVASLDPPLTIPKL